MPDMARIPGLTRVFSPAAAQAMQLVELRVFDAVLSSEDLAALSIEDCLRYREKTADERSQFRKYLAEVVSHLRHDVWSAEIENEISEEIERAQREINDQGACKFGDLQGRFAPDLMAGRVCAGHGVVLWAGSRGSLSRVRGRGCQVPAGGRFGGVGGGWGMGAGRGGDT